MKKRLLSVLLVICMVLTLMPMAALADFADTAGHWGKDSIDRWANVGVLNGKGDNAFDPNGNMTRAEFAQMLCNMMGYTELAPNTYTDIPENAWFREAMLKLIAAGVINGVGNNMVAPNDPITREQAAVMLQRAFKIPVKASSLNYADAASVSSWARDAVATLTALGMISGVGDNQVAPKLDINRASVAKLIDNMVAEYVTEDKTITGEVNGIILVADGAKVTLDNATVNAPIIVAPAAKGSTVALTGTTTAENVVLAAENAAVTVGKDATVDSVVAAAAKADVTVDGTAGSVVVEGADTNVAVSGTVSSVEVAAGADNTAISTTETAKIDSVTTSADSVKVTGNGTVDKVTIEDGNVAVTTKGTEVVNNKDYTDNPSTPSNPSNPSTPSGGGGGGGGGSSEPSVTNYAITVAAAVGGKVEANYVRAVVDTEVTLTVTAEEGYALDTLTVVDADGAAVTVTDNKFKMPAKDVTVTATFKAIPVAGKPTVAVSAATLADTADEVTDLTTAYSVREDGDTIVVLAKDIKEHTAGNGTKAYWIGASFAPATADGDETEYVILCKDKDGKWVIDTDSCDDGSIVSLYIKAYNDDDTLNTLGGNITVGVFAKDDAIDANGVKADLADDAAKVVTEYTVIAGDCTKYVAPAKTAPTLKVEAGSEDVWGKKATDIQGTLTIAPDAETPTTVKVTGDSKYLSWPEFSSKADEQQGNYVYLKFTLNKTDYPDATATFVSSDVSPKTLIAAGATEETLVWCLNTNKTIAITVNYGDSQTVAYTVDLSGMTLGAKPAAKTAPTLTVAAADGEVWGKQTTALQGTLTIADPATANDVTTIKVTGDSEYIGEKWTQFSSIEDEQTGNYVHLKFTLAPGDYSDAVVTFKSTDDANKTLIAAGTTEETMVWRLNKNKAIEITITYDEGKSTVSYKVDLTGMTLKTAGPSVIEVTGVTLDKDTVTLNGLGDTAELVATVEPADATDKTVTWSSDNESVVTVTKKDETTATVTAVGGGTATITVTTTSGGRTATAQATVNVVNEAGVIAAPIVDQAGAVDKDDIGTVSVESKAVAGATKEYDVTITGTAIVKHTNGNNVEGYWVGFAVPYANAPEGQDGDGKYTFKAGTQELTSAAHRNTVGTDKDGNEVTYTTIYFDENDQKEAKIVVTVNEGDTVVATYNVSFKSMTYAYKVTGGDNVTADKAYVAAGQTATVTVTVPTGEEVEAVTAAPTTGDAITATAGANNKYSFTMPAADVTVTVTFKQPVVTNYTVTIDESIENGTVTSDAAAAGVAAGTKVTLTVTPAQGYELDELKANNEDVTKDADGNYTFTMPAANVTVTASFKTETPPEADITVVAAPIADHASGDGKTPIPAANLGTVTIESIEKDASATTTTYNVKVKGEKIMKHANAEGTVGYWVGFGMPIGDNVAYSYTVDGENTNSAAIAARTCEDANGNKYNTAYFKDSTEASFNADTPVVVVQSWTEEGVAKSITYNVTFDVSFWKAADAVKVIAVGDNVTTVLSALEKDGTPWAHKFANGLGFTETTMDGTTIKLNGSTTLQALKNTAEGKADDNGYLTYVFEADDNAIAALKLDNETDAIAANAYDTTLLGMTNGVGIVMNKKIYTNGATEFDSNIKTTWTLIDTAGREQGSVEVVIDTTDATISDAPTPGADVTVSVASDLTGGAATLDKTSGYKAGDTVTVTVTVNPTAGEYPYVCTGVTVASSVNTETVTVTKDESDATKYTFTIPADAAADTTYTVTPAFAQPITKAELFVVCDDASYAKLKEYGYTSGNETYEMNAVKTNPWLVFGAKVTTGKSFTRTGDAVLKFTPSAEGGDEQTLTDKWAQSGPTGNAENSYKTAYIKAVDQTDGTSEQPLGIDTDGTFNLTLTFGGVEYALECAYSKPKQITVKFGTEDSTGEKYTVSNEATLEVTVPNTVTIPSHVEPTVAEGIYTAGKYYTGNWKNGSAVLKVTDGKVTLEKPSTGTWSDVELTPDYLEITEQPVALRRNGPEGHGDPEEGNFDYKAAYTAAGITLTGTPVSVETAGKDGNITLETSTKGITVDVHKLVEYIKGQNAITDENKNTKTLDNILDGTGAYVVIGLEYVAPVDAATMVQVHEWANIAELNDKSTATNGNIMDQDGTTEIGTIKSLVKDDDNVYNRAYFRYIPVIKAYDVSEESSTLAIKLDKYTDTETGRYPINRYYKWYDADGNLIAVTKANNVTRVLENEKFTVRFDPNGGSVTYGSNSYTNAFSLSQICGFAVSMPTNPTRDNASFDGWYIADTDGNASEEKYEVANDQTTTNPITEDFTLIAKWTTTGGNGDGE